MVSTDFSEEETFKLRPKDGQVPAMGKMGEGPLDRKKTP